MTENKKESWSKELLKVSKSIVWLTPMYIPIRKIVVQQQFQQLFQLVAADGVTQTQEPTHMLNRRQWDVLYLTMECW